MHAEKSDDYTSNVSAPVLTEDVIQDLRKMTQGIGSLAAIKAERREQALAREQEAREEIARIQAELTPQFFLSQTPKTFTGSDAPIPEWKRQMIAKKMAVAAAKKEEERIWCEFEEWKKQFEPNWKKTNNQRSSITNPQSP
uniref:Uncharacterized protein n=1 Tax=Plectus sambesii TaxID=2011161 RepID=A0A914X878_9BILA